MLVELEPILEKRNVFGVPIKYGEDRFLTRQIVKAGYRTLMTMDAFCYTKAPTTLTGYFNQQLRWKRSNIVDFVGGLSHAWRLHPLVCVHYLSMFALLLVYPFLIIGHLVEGDFVPLIAFHVGLVGPARLRLSLRAVDAAARSALPRAPGRGSCPWRS